MAPNAARKSFEIKPNLAVPKTRSAECRLLHKLLGYLSKVAPKFSKVPQKLLILRKSCSKVAFYQLMKNQFLLLMKVNLCTSIRIIYLFIYSFLLADISIPTEMIL